MAFMPSKLRVPKPTATPSGEVGATGGCCAPSGPDPAILLRAETLGACPRSLQGALKSLCHGTCYTWLCQKGKKGFAESEPMAHRGLPREEALGGGKADFKPSISQKAETEGSCARKEENRGDLNRSEPAERDEEGEKHHRNETVPATFHRQSKENSSQEAEKGAAGRRMHPGVLPASSQASDKPEASRERRGSGSGA